MISIPKFAQSSIDPTQVSLTIVSIGKAGVWFIGFLAMAGLVDPTIANQQWGTFVADVGTAVPVAFAIYHSGNAVWGLVRKTAVNVIALVQKIFGKKTTVPAQQ